MNLKIKNLKLIIKKEKTVVRVAEEMNVSRQSVHKWLIRFKQYGEEGLVTPKQKRSTIPKNRTSLEVEQMIIQLARTYWNDGVQTLSDHLQYEHNITLNPSTIWRILKRNDIRYTTRQPRTRKKWKKQLYAHQVPGQELQMDTKYPYGYKQGKVIYTIIDDATRWVYVYCYDTANAQNTLDFLDRVRSKAPFPIQKIRTDQGSEFRATRVRSYLSENGIEHRLNTPYCPEQNGKIERFHRTLNEKALRFGFKPSMSLEAMQYRLVLFLGYYNWRKKHRGLGMDGKTPIQRLQELGSVNLTVRCYNSIENSQKIQPYNLT